MYVLLSHAVKIKSIMETAQWTVKAASAGEDLEITMHATDFYSRVEVSENMGVVLFYFYFFIFFFYIQLYTKR